MLTNFYGVQFHKKKIIQKIKLYILKVIMTFLHQLTLKKALNNLNVFLFTNKVRSLFWVLQDLKYRFQVNLGFKDLRAVLDS